jgi:phospholipid-binding lipoprotein MlaA
LATGSTAVLSALLLAGCSPKQQSSAPVVDSGAAVTANDPLEGFNRVVFKINTTIDKYALRPVAKVYRDYTPQPIRTGVTNVLHNIESPVILINDVLQANPPHAGQTVARIGLNTVFGLGGFIDVAAHEGIPYHDSDFGQTLGVWGVGPGPYLMLPLLGPSNPRDTVGFGVDAVIDPFSYEMREAGVATDASIARTGATVINRRSQTIDELDDLQRNSLDFYAAIRSLYRQKRQGDIAAGRHGSLLHPKASRNVTAEEPGEVPHQDVDMPMPIVAGLPPASPAPAAGGDAGNTIPQTENTLPYWQPPVGTAPQYAQGKLGS